MNGYRKNNFEAYGVYAASSGAGDGASAAADDDHGFLASEKKTQNNQAQFKGVMVNASGESSVVMEQKRPVKEAMTTSMGSPWCRPTILLLMLVLLIVIFVLVAGILLYFNYMSYKPRHPVIEGKELNYPSSNNEPCEKTFCAWGMTCVVSDAGQAMCQCQKTCPEARLPVCGEDGVTYDNQCQLRRTSCLKRKEMRVKHQGPCEKTDPCAKLNCSLGSHCVRTPDGEDARCECMDSCPSHGDHDAAGPVCGSDGVDYPSLCDLNRVACSTSTNISVAFRGKCDPCAGVECTEPEICQLDAQRQPACRCNEQCGPEHEPVCGSDGKTYANECNLRLEACRTRQRDLRKIYAGACNSGVNPCDGAKCGPQEQCAIDRYGIAKCECGPECEAVMRPVCARGGTTYASHCELKRQACITRTSIELAYSGVCGSRGPCSDKICQWGAECVEINGIANCECPSCSAEFQPVCGDDGISYGNECKLRHEACQHRREIRVLYHEQCNVCESKKCEHYGVCETDTNGEAKCVCPSECSNNSSESSGSSSSSAVVCGSDGVTYDSECELKKVSCKTQSLIVVSYKGDCEQCANVACENGARCEAGQCICPLQCPEPTGDSVCGSNSKTYPSECELQKAACQREPHLPPLHVTFYGECGEGFPVAALSLEVKPCNGEQPMLDSEGKEYDCGDGPNRRDCPSLGYCHRTPRFARCCSKISAGPGGGVNGGANGGSNAARPPATRCEDSWHGCCPDGRTAALGPDGAGCPNQCGCNRHGSLADTCDPESGQCQCRPGVGGLKCDRCMPGYWGLSKIDKGHQGCIPCGCSLFGSTREDCEQMTGLCVCKPEIQGKKCTICTDHNKILTPKGCQPVDAVLPIPSSCNKLECYSGGQCSESSSATGLAAPHCVCPNDCPEDSPARGFTVCGSDGQTYDNECELKLYACRYQTDVVAQAFGQCRDDSMTANTDLPVKRFTAMHYTQPDAAISPLSKSTKHLMVPEPDARYYYTNRAGSEETPPVDRKNLKQGSAAAYRPTPATIRVVTPILGEYCAENKDCVIIGSICKDSRCACGPDYVETSDRQDCSSIGDNAPVLPTEEFRACSSSPCHPKSICIDLPGSTYTCQCHEDYLGFHCDEPVNRRDYEVASFDGKSYVRMNKLKGYFKISIDVEFKTYAENGILMYNQQKVDGTGDFVSLAIVDGFVQFRYNLGNGPVILTSAERVSMKQFHRISAKRYHKDGVLQFNEGDEVAGQSEGMLKSLDLNQDTYIGNIPTNYSKVFDNIGTSHGFLGCIRKLRVNREPIDLHMGYDRDILETYRIKECRENGCANLPCQNGATCQPIFEEDLNCRGNDCLLAPGGRRSKRRNRRGGKQRRSSNGPENMSVVKCKGGQCDLNNNNSNNNNNNSYNEESRRPCLEPGCDHPLMEDDQQLADYDDSYERQGYEAVELEYQCICPPEYTGKNCEKSLDPCNSAPCHHSATCDILPEGGYLCKCPPGRTGQHCEILDAELTEFMIPEMHGDGFLELPCLEGVARTFSIELWFLTRATDGLLLYNGQLANGRGDFISLNLVDGLLEFRYNLGSGIANITSPDPVSLDTWHSVRISRLGREGLLRLDNGTVARGFSGSPLTELNLEMPLYIGGVRHWHEVHPLAEASTGMFGAVQRLMVNDKTYQNLAVNFTQHNTEIYDGLPCPSDSNPCRNNGVCFPLLNSFFCKCAKGYDGINCEFFMGYDFTGREVVEPAVRFTGENFLQFKHRYGRSLNVTNTTNLVVDDSLDESEIDYDTEDDAYDDYDNYDYSEGKGQESNKFELRLRTTHSEGVIAWVGRGKLEHMMLSLHEGYVVLSYRDRREQFILRSNERVDDGYFHHIRAVRRRRSTVLHIDDQIPIKQMIDTGPLVTNGRLFVGGRPGHRGVKGCMRNFVADKRSLHLSRRKIELCHDNDVRRR
ncbi:agrin-like isoform X1 [Trichogramma pretiosum]|uniref:agrin-like isoform X1 n=1 Tax=Trichogramma pretiosum TaxID=7493 RepID=UPI000C718CE1|nr:agrin-like isoform X1 [Trichogramma pretiosum]